MGIQLGKFVQDEIKFSQAAINVGLQGKVWVLLVRSNSVAV